MEKNSLCQQVSRPLVNWFKIHQRVLPWRIHYSPYSVWISEIMLQQTQVDRVVPYYHRWMERFPTIGSVAMASLDELLKLWEGLGYYSRVKYLHRAAQIIQNDYSGRFPDQHHVLLKLPGIGPYTAGAIMSIAYNQNFPLVDGNVIRVLARIFNVESSIGDGETKALMWKKAEELISPGESRWLNQALMELGALICTPKNPGCPDCPVYYSCQSFLFGCVELRPVVPPSKKNTPIEVVVGVLMEDGCYLIQQRPPNGLMAGLWEFPGGKIKGGEKPEDALVREFKEELALCTQVGEKITTIKHGYTSFSVTLHAFFCTLVPSRQSPILHFASTYRWVKPGEFKDFAFPAANRRLVNKLAKQ